MSVEKKAPYLYLHKDYKFNPMSQLKPTGDLVYDVSDSLSGIYPSVVDALKKSLNVKVKAFKVSYSKSNMLMILSFTYLLID